MVTFPSLLFKFGLIARQPDHNALMHKTSVQVQFCYERADATYSSSLRREASNWLGQVPLINHNPLRGEKIDLSTHKALRYKVRSSAKWVNAHLKDNHVGRRVWARSNGCNCKLKQAYISSQRNLF
jgi:hypothetical protein